MSRPLRTAASVLLLAVAPLAEGEVVLLQNGSLFEGVVERSADGVLVQGEGSLVRLRPADVAYVGESAAHAYEWRRGQAERTGSDAPAHLALADWAIKNRLWPQAARELLEARALDPASRRLALLERRLDELTRPVAPTPRGSAPVAPRSVAADVRPDEPLGPRGAPLREADLEVFTRRIQPMLLNSCATAGCHGVEGVGVFALDLAPLRGYGDARSTERNLAATLAALDPAAPDSSPLLRAAVGPHAGVTPLRGARRDEMLARLAAWVESVTSAQAETAPSEVADHAADDAAVAVAPTTPHEDPLAATSGDAAVPPEEEGAADMLFEGGRVRRGVALRRVAPRDEFDPEVFNTRHRRPQDDLPEAP